MSTTLLGHLKAPVKQSRFRPRFTAIRPDLSQMVKSGCIRMHRDGNKKENQASIRCLTMLLWCLHDTSTDPLRLMKGSATIHHGGATNAHDASTIRYGASMIQAGSATVASRPLTNVHDSVVVMRQPWGRGYSHVGSGPASTVHPPPPPKKYRY